VRTPFATWKVQPHSIDTVCRMGEIIAPATVIDKLFRQGMHRARERRKP